MKKIVTIVIIGILFLSMLPILELAAKAEQSEAYLTNFLQLTTNPMRDRSPICSPDGSKIAYFAFDSSNWYRHIWTMNPDGSGKTQITFGGVIDETGDYSPDGTEIVFMRYRGNELLDLYIMNADGSDIRQLTSIGLSHHRPRWSHDGQRLAYAYGSYTTSDDMWEIHLMNIDDSNDVTVFSSDLRGMWLNAYWSADDSKILCNNYDGIWLVDTYPPYNKVHILTTTVPVIDMVYSPDGQYILYSQSEIGQYQDLYLIDSNGNFIAQLTNDASIEYQFDWSPDGQYIVFGSKRSGNDDIWRAKIITPSNLVGYWKFDEGSGNSASDSSGNGNTGTLVNAPQWVSGISGSALSFDGVASFVNIPSSSSLVVHGDQVAVEMWIKPAITLDYSTPTMDPLTKGNEYAFALNHEDRGNPNRDGKMRFWIGIATPDYFVPECVETVTDRWMANTWYHLAGTYDGISLRIYVNGILENSRPVSGNLWTQEPNFIEYPLSIAAYTWGMPYIGNLFFFNGAIDEVKIYSCARTAEEVLNDYNSVKVAIPWRDDFNYNSRNEMKTAGWSLEHEELINVGGGVLTLDDDGSAMARSFFRNFASSIYDFKAETKAKWTGRTYGSLLLFVETERHKYSLHLDGYYPNYAFVRDRMEDEIRFDGYVPEFNTWLTMGFEKRGNTVLLYQDDRVIYTYIDPDEGPDALTGVGIAPGWISANQYDYISVATPSQPDFDISVSPESQIAQPDSSAYYHIVITSKNGFSSSVTLTASFSPSPLNYGYHLLPAIVTPTPNGQATATLEFDTYTDTPLKTYTITITATGGGISKSNSTRLNVERSLEVPYQNQGYAQWCSPTSMAMVLRYYGYAFHSWNYAKAKHLSTDQGVRIEEMKPYIDDNYKDLTAKVGYYGLLTKSVVLDDIRSNLTFGFPVIIQLGKLVWGLPSTEGHAVVATGFNETGLFINDPSGALFIEEGFLHLTSTDPKYPKSWIHAYVDWSDIYQFIRTAPFASIMTIQGTPRLADNLGSIYVTSRIGVVFYHPGDGQGGALTQDYYSLHLNKGLIWMKNYSKQQKWEIKEDNVIASDCNALFVSLGVANSGSMTQSFKFYLDILDSKGVVQPLMPRPIDNLAGFKEDKESASGGFIDVSQFLTKGVQYRLDLYLRDSSDKVVDHFQSEPFYWVEATKAKLTENKKHLYLHAYDEQGNHIGLNYTSGQIELGIPDSYYFDDGNGTITILVPKIIGLQLLVDAKYAEEPIESYNLTVTMNSDVGFYSQTYSGNIAVGDKQTFTTEASETSLTLYLNADVDTDPNTLNLVSKGEPITVHIALPKGIDLSSIDVSSILLNETILVKPSAPVTIGDYNNDGVPDLMVKFERSQVINCVLAHVPNSAKFMVTTLTVTGYLNDGTAFRGSDTIRIIFSKPIAK